MHIIYLYIFSLLALGLSSCKPKEFLPDDYKGEYLLIGHGGGFTGQTIEYQILENGKVFRKNSLDGTVKEGRTISKDTYNQIISNYERLGLQAIYLNQPGNMYYYLIMKTDTKEHKVVWDNSRESEEQAKLKLFFNTVFHRVKNE